MKSLKVRMARRSAHRRNAWLKQHRRARAKIVMIDATRPRPSSGGGGCATGAFDGSPKENQR